MALFSRGRPTTYGALRDQVAHLRGGLSGLGVAAGDRVVLLCSNGRYFVDLYLAILGVGAVAVPLNPTSPASAIEREVTAVGASVVVVEPSSAAAWAQVRREAVPSVHHVVSTELVEAQATVDHTFEDLLAAAPLPMVEVAADSGFHAIFARINASGEASIALHRKWGFELVGIEREVGRKFNRWHDVALMQRLL